MFSGCFSRMPCWRTNRAFCIVVKIRSPWDVRILYSVDYELRRLSTRSRKHTSRTTHCENITMHLPSRRKPESRFDDVANFAHTSLDQYTGNNSYTCIDVLQDRLCRVMWIYRRRGFRLYTTVKSSILSTIPIKNACLLSRTRVLTRRRLRLNRSTHT
jgi:hypothetical protein